LDVAAVSVDTLGPLFEIVGAASRSAIGHGAPSCEDPPSKAEAL